MSSSLTISPSFVQTILFVCLFVCVCVCVCFYVGGGGGEVGGWGDGGFLYKMRSCNFFENCCPQTFYLRLPNMTYEAPGNLCRF